MQISRVAERRSWGSPLLIVAEGKNGKVEGREQQIEKERIKTNSSESSLPGLCLLLCLSDFPL